jgi:hypothetical protein
LPPCPRYWHGFRRRNCPGMARTISRQLQHHLRPLTALPNQFCESNN